MEERGGEELGEWRSIDNFIGGVGYQDVFPHAWWGNTAG